MSELSHFAVVMRINASAILLILGLTITAGLTNAYSKTFTAVANGNWVLPGTWSCNCTPMAGDNVIIPYGITVSISRPLALNALTITVAGVLDLSNGLIQMDESDRLTVVPGGKVLANGLGGRINVGVTTHDLRHGTVIEGPATIGTKILQVALMFFEAKSDDEQLTLRWASVGELDVKQYEVVCYHDSTRYEHLGELRGLNYSLTRRDYHFPILKPHSNVEFYRLEAVGNDSTRMILSTAMPK